MTGRARAAGLVGALALALAIGPTACSRSNDFRAGRGLTVGSPLGGTAAPGTATSTAKATPTSTAAKPTTTRRGATTTTQASVPGCAEYRAFQSRQQAAKVAEPGALAEAIRQLDTSAEAMAAAVPDKAESIDVTTRYLEATLGQAPPGDPPTAAQASRASRDLRTWYTATCTPR